MICVFPTPYPGELFYGIIARYHIHSGNTVWQDTLKELFPNCKYPNIGDLMPNDTIRHIYELMPAPKKTLKNFILEHTLLAYEMRFQPAEKKKEHMAEFIAGESIQQKLLVYTKKKRISRPLRYCPRCHGEDMKTYGEPYLRTEHQIDILTICPKHRCRLIELPRKQSMTIGRQLILLPIESLEADFNTTLVENEIADAVHYLYGLPFLTSPSVETHNLQVAVENAGLLTPGSIKQSAWDTQKVYDALTEKFGAEYTASTFGPHLTRAHALRLSKYNIYSTDEYVLLTVMLGIFPAALFSKKPLHNMLQEKMLAMSKTGHMYTKHTAAKELGIEIKQLLPYAKRFCIEPFWSQSGKRREINDKQTYTVAINLSENELQTLKAYMQQNNIDVYSHALRLFMKKELSQWEKQNGL